MCVGDWEPCLLDSLRVLLNLGLYRSTIRSLLALKIKTAPSQAPNGAKRWPKSGVLEAFESKTDLNRYEQHPHRGTNMLKGLAIQKNGGKDKKGSHYCCRKWK